MFDLTITFGGLCILVRDPAHGMLHVLMPDSTAHPHVPSLVFVDQAGQPQTQDIRNMHLELPGVTGSFNSAIPSEVFDFGGPLLGSRTIHRGLLEPATPLPAGSVVSARMRLTAGKHGLVRHRGGIWNFNLADGPVPRRLPTTLDWLIEDIDLPHLVIEDMVGGGTFEVFPGPNNRIHMLVVHVPQSELQVIGPDIPDPDPTKCPDNGAPATHFGLYTPLLTPRDPLALPEFDRPKSRAVGLCNPQLAATRQASQAHEQATGVAAGAAAAAAAAAVAVVAPDAAAAAAAAAAQAASAATTALSAAAAPAAAAAAGSELTCMITTAPAG